MARKKQRKPQLVVEDSNPTAVILDIRDYQQMLERLEEADDLAALEKLRTKPLKFRPLDEFLREHEGRV